MRKLLSFVAAPVLLALLLAPTGARSIAAWPEQGTLERVAELSAPAHPAPEAPRLQSDLGQGQGSARHDGSRIGVLPDRFSSLVPRLSSLAVRPEILRTAAGRTRRGNPLFPTGPPGTVS